MKNDSEKLFKEMAARYTEVYGQNLKEEMKNPEAMAVGQDSIAALDKKLARGLAKERYKKFSYPLAAAAACILLLFGARALFDPFPYSESPDYAAEPGEPEPEMPYAFINVNLNLSPDFSLDHVEQDREKTIYYIENAQYDHVVLTAQHLAEEEDFRTDGLRYVALEDFSAYAASKGDYQLLTFLRADVIYTLTCKYDVNTLVAVGRNIL